jgi:anti-sigma-K factor RskA
MNHENHVTGPQGCGADAAAYALGALEPAEAEEFERHLEQCVVCADDLKAFEHVAGALAISAHQHPVPSDLRRRVLDIIRSDQRPELFGTRRESSSFRLIALRGRLARAAVSAAITTIAAAIAVIAIVTRSSPSPSAVRVVAARVVGSPGSAQVRLTGEGAELVVHHFRSPPAGLIYEVWLKRPGQRLAPSGVLFSVTARGAGNIGVPGQMRGVSEILVTPEPAGGSPAPTHQPVIDARLS